MIDITIGTTGNRDINYIDIRGHAGHSTRGTDIVCSAVSILTHLTTKMADGERGVTIHDGDSYCIKIDYNKTSPWAELNMNNYLTQLSELFEELEHSYPDNVSVRFL